MTVRARQLTAIACVVLTATAAGIWIGRSTGPSPSASSTHEPGPVDIGFARDMAEHHSQAVTMSLIVLEQSAAPEIRVLARNILTAQQLQMGQLKGWLLLWNMTEQASHPMAWMPHRQHPDHSDTFHPQVMPGMASGPDLTELATMTPADADQQFLRLMLNHHHGGIVMAQFAADHASLSEVKQLASAMVSAQQIEIAQIDYLSAQH
ncbi:DUF305 domain-containing protein [Nocardia sp. CA-128927]|uniref:DUF305 domain-containing protein n=1 Tax=Nocardia sp. CA-128927 TaxID=3239975 RepID=UPI003D96CDC2